MTQLTRQPLGTGRVVEPITAGQANSVIDSVWGQIAQVLNAGLTWGNPTKGPVNMRGAWYDAITPAGANTAFSVTHNLGYIPQGYIVIYQNAACSIYDSGTAWTKTTISLKCSASSVHIRLFVIG